MKECSIEECKKPARTRGWCEMHYGRWRRNGDPDVVLKKRASGGFSAIERFSESYFIENDCWSWNNTVSMYGYGRFWEDGTEHLAHRWSYEHHFGPIPEGLELDHLCRNRKCVNPEHLEPVTSKENRERGLHGALRTHCQAGHELTSENTYLKHEPDGTRRVCRECARATSREFQRAKRKKGILSS